MVEMRLAGLSLDREQKVPLALLQEVEGSRTLPLALAPTEAMALSLALNQTGQTLPATHALLLNLLQHCKHSLRTVELTAIRNGVLHACLVLDDGTLFSQVACRPADALTLATQAAVPICVHEAVFQDIDSLRIPAGVDSLSMPVAAPRRPNLDFSHSENRQDSSEKTWEEILRRMNPVSSRKM
jgi:uncharacterized protein